MQSLAMPYCSVTRNFDCLFIVTIVIYVKILPTDILRFFCFVVYPRCFISYFHITYIYYATNEPNIIVY